MSESSIVVVGAGIVGASIALSLQRDGHRVTLVDRSEPGAGASFGNAGVIVNKSCVPTAMPGAPATGLRMLFNPLAPFVVRAAYLPRIVPWLARFVWQSRPLKADHNARSLFELTKSAVQSWRLITDSTPLTHQMRATGWLKVYGTNEAFTATAAARALMDQCGTPYKVINAAEIREMEPNLAPVFPYGIFQEDSLSLTNPQKMLVGMVQHFTSSGGNFRKADVHTISASADSASAAGNSDAINADRIVLATGASSRPFASQLGDRIPLDTERGYHLLFSKEAGAQLSRPVMNGDMSFVLSPMEMGLRLTGLTEFAGVDAPADYRRIRRLLPYAQRMVPGLRLVEESAWMGCRPSLPDSLPVIGYASASRRVMYAFGHQHLGMTLGPRTGAIIADLIAGRQSEIDLAPYCARRFA